jgi:hypothetical protein
MMQNPSPRLVEPEVLGQPCNRLKPQLNDRRYSRRRESSALPWLQTRFSDNGVQIQRAVEMRELGSARLGGLVSKLGLQPPWINPKKNQIPLAAVHGVRGEMYLLRPRQVDKSLPTERRRNVLADVFRLLPLGLPRNMNDQATHRAIQDRGTAMTDDAPIGARTVRRA